MAESIEEEQAFYRPKTKADRRQPTNQERACNQPISVIDHSPTRKLGLLDMIINIL